MEKANFRIKGHESFVLREGWLTKGLFAVKDNSKLFLGKGGADELGVGTNMAKSIRYWLQAGNLTTESTKYGTRLSELGEIIFSYDPYFEDVFSLWLYHINLVRNESLATSWNVFFNDISISTFDREELYSVMNKALIEYTGADSLPERSVKDDCSAIINMYSVSKDQVIDPEEKKISPFTELGLLVPYRKNLYERIHPSFDSIDSLLILYMINDSLSDEGSLPIDEVILGRNMPGKVLNINRLAVNEYLDELQNRGYIIINRTAGLDMVYPTERTYSNTDLIRRYYERKSK